MAEKAAEWDKLHWRWLRLDVGGKGHVHVQLQASQFSKQKQWSEWGKDFALSVAEQFRRGAGAGAGVGRGLGKSRRSWSQGPPHLLRTLR